MYGIVQGLKPIQFEIMPLGFSIKFEKTQYQDKKNTIKNIITSLAGPITNILLIIILLKLDTKITQIQLAIYCNILICLFNLIPVYPLDGWSILNGILHIKLRESTAEKYSRLASLITIIAFTVFCSIATYYFQNISFFLIDILLWIKYLREV